ncbi:MAG: glycosyltransferase family 4 protein [Roseiflexaceae bacterium]|nr:glycosyltransferase family 4 protein [Roseiflexaceae bacterium]
MNPIRTLFLQSQSFFGADTELHVQLMRYFDRKQVKVHVALTNTRNENINVDPQSKIKSISDINILPTDFGGQSTASLTEKIGRFAALGLLVPRLRNYIKKNNIQILHGTEKPRDAFNAVLLGKLTGAKSIVHMHVSYGEWLKPSVKWALRNADGIIAVSAFSQQSIINAGHPADRVYSVLNALDDQSGRWNPRDASDIRRELHIPNTSVVLGIISRLFLYKGHLDLLDALARVDQQIPDYRLVIVGEDDPRAHPGGGSFMAEIKAHAQRLGLSEKLIFTGFRTDIPALMASFDMYTMPSWEEPFGMVFVEAMSMEKPVVAWHQAGPIEIVIDGETGFLVPPKDIPALGHAILNLAKDGAMRRRFGVAGRARVLSYFNSQRMCADVLSVYKQTLAKPKR